MLFSYTDKKTGKTRYIELIPANAKALEEQYNVKLTPVKKKKTT